jgi:IS30 family transposase
LGRNKSTISRELRRNAWKAFKAEYNPGAAQRYYGERRSHTKKRTSPLQSRELRDYIEEKMKIGWSPEVISNRLKIENNPWRISHESIYQYIYRERKDLIRYLRWNKNKKKRGKRGAKRNQLSIPNRIFIDERPERVNRRVDFGDWETDLMESSKAGKSHLNVLVERKSRYISLRKVASKEAVEKKKATIEQLEKLPVGLRKTITYDNGTENRNHEKINLKLGMQSYFCHAYSSWEKGTVENSIGLIRYYLPKKTNLDMITESVIADIETLLNNRPRKVLGFRTPIEVLQGVALVT